MTSQVQDLINSPKHYTSHPSNVECLEIVENMPFCVGNAFKYIFRRKYKGMELIDLHKALFYVKHAIKLQNADEIYALKLDELYKIMAAEDLNAPINTWGKVMFDLVMNQNLEQIQVHLERELAYLQFQDEQQAQALN